MPLDLPVDNLSDDERRRRLLGLAPAPSLARPQPAVRVAFGNKGLTGVQPPSRGFESPSRALRDPLAGGFEEGAIGGMPASAIKLPLRLRGLERPPTSQPTLSPPSPIDTTTFKLPDEMTHPVLGPIKPNVAGLSPVDRNVAVLDAQRQAATDFPSSSVTAEGEVNPPKLHHGFKDRLKSIGKGALIGLGAGGPGGAIAGAITGGVSPVTIDKVMAQRALQRKTAEVGQQIDIETGRARLEDLRMKPAIEAAKIQIQQQVDQGKITRAEAQQQMAQIRQTETERHNRELERLGQARIDKPGATGAGDAVGARQEAARQRKYDAATRELESLTAAETEAAKQKDAAYAEYGTLQKQYERQADANARAALKPQLDAAKDKAEKAQQFYATFGAKKTKAMRDVGENQPTRSQPSYSGRTMTQANLARYAKDKGLSEADARKQIEAMGVTIR